MSAWAAARAVLLRASMSHLCLADGTVLFADAFGLTRFAPDARPKTDTKVYAQPTLPLTVGGSPPRVFLHGPESYTRRLLSVDDLARVATMGHGEAMLPDGERFVCGGVDDVRDARNQVLAPFGLREAPRRERISLDAGLFHPARVMGGPAVADDGRVAYLWPGVDDCELALIDTTPAVRTRWRVELRAGSDAIVTAAPTRAGVAVVGWRPVAGKAAVVDLDADGNLLARCEIDARAMPALDDERVVFQRDDASVTARDRATGEERAFDLAALVAAAPRKKNAPDPLDPRGTGTVVAGRGRTLFVPWHGEALLDLDRGVALDRRLSAAQRPHRAAFAAWVRDHRDMMLAHGIVAPIRFRCDGAPGVTLWSCLARGNARDVMAVPRQLAEHLVAQTGLKMRSYGTAG